MTRGVTVALPPELAFRNPVSYRHKTWAEAFAAADARARATGWRYWVRHSPVGWWLVSRIPNSAWLPSVRRG